MNNSHYRGHGAAIHYSYMNNTKKFPNDRFAFTISNCYFIDNKHIKSLVYIDNRLFNYHKIIFNNVMFISNQGICVYVINHKIYIDGNAMFKNNVAGNGTGIYISNHSRVIFDENSNVTFSQNLADSRGGVVFLTNHSICLFDQTSIVTFYYNKATIGGAIYSEAHSNVTFKETCKVIFTSNSASQNGAAIFSFGNSHVVFAGIARTKFGSSVVPYHKNLGNDSTRISLEENFNVLFLYNTADYGGAIYCETYCHISFEKASTTMFSNNNAHYRGGAISSNDNSYISFEGTSTTVFSDNTAYGNGGAIISYRNSYVSFEGNSSTELINNTAYYGGAVFSYDSSSLSFEEYSVIEFTNNAKQKHLRCKKRRGQSEAAVI